MDLEQKARVLHEDMTKHVCTGVPVKLLFQYGVPILFSCSTILLMLQLVCSFFYSCLCVIKIRSCADNNKESEKKGICQKIGSSNERGRKKCTLAICISI